MIAPYLVEDKDVSGRWWCFYKPNGASMSYREDLQNWTYAGRMGSSQNVCLLLDNNE